jgi:hypothetical protein
MRYFQHPDGALYAYDEQKQNALIETALAAGWSDLGTTRPAIAPRPLTPEQTLAMRKIDRQALVDAITVTTTSGKVFDGNETAQSRMAKAILTAGIIDQTETTWVLANNVPTRVTLAELQEALALAMQAQSAVWASPYQ